jgi:hypothetical protein
MKRKEDDRRRNIQPSDTLFVVNFQEDTTKREDLKMLFESFGELVRVDMKRNYGFVQFCTIDEATQAKDATDGDKLDQRVMTVEFVARYVLMNAVEEVVVLVVSGETVAVEVVDSVKIVVTVAKTGHSKVPLLWKDSIALGAEVTLSPCHT